MIRRVSAKASALLRACSQHGFFAAGDGELRAPLCVAFRSLFVAAGIFFQLFASAFFASCCFCAYFGGELCCVSVLSFFLGGRSTECKSLLGCVGMLRGNCVLGFSVLSKWLQTP